MAELCGHCRHVSIFMTKLKCYFQYLHTESQRHDEEAFHAVMSSNPHTVSEELHSRRIYYLFFFTLKSGFCCESSKNAGTYRLKLWGQSRLSLSMWLGTQLQCLVCCIIEHKNIHLVVIPHLTVKTAVWCLFYIIMKLYVKQGISRTSEEEGLQCWGKNVLSFRRVQITELHFRCLNSVEVGHLWSATPYCR